MWPTRKLMSLSRSCPFAITMPCRSRIALTITPAEIPAGDVMAVTAFDGRSANGARPIAVAAARVADAFIAWRATTFSRPSSRIMASVSSSPTMSAVAGVNGVSPSAAVTAAFRRSM
jgi:hypothetical protein